VAATEEGGLALGGKTRSGDWTDRVNEAIGNGCELEHRWQPWRRRPVLTALADVKAG
jgi:hypothetical protein